MFFQRMSQNQKSPGSSATPDFSESRKLGRGGKLALVVSATLLTVALCEILCRLIDVGDAPETADYIADWELQWGSDFYTLDPRYPAPGEFINSDGLRDRQYTVAKPDETLRIACLGDSVTYGFLARQEDSYPSQLETLLRDDDVNAEVFNIALPGWTIRQQRIAYQQIARKYRPDCVVLGICLNDISEMQNNLLEPPGALPGFLHRHSNLFRAIVRSPEREIESVEELCKAADSPHVNLGWERYFAELEKFKSAIAGDDVALIAVVFPFRFQIQGDTAPDLPQRRLRSHFAEVGTMCIDLLPALRPHGSEAFLDYDHLSPQGSGAVAAVLKTALIEEGGVDFKNGENRN